MIQHVWTVVCRLSLTDQGSNAVSLIEVIEEIELSSGTTDISDAKWFVPIVEIVSLWSRRASAGPETGQGRTAFLSPNGQAVIESTFDIDLKATHRTRTIGKFFIGVALEPGIYHVVVSKRIQETEEWEEQATIPIEVRRQESVSEAKNLG